MELTIYNKTGEVKKIVSPNSNSEWTEEVGVEHVVSVTFSTWEFFILSVGDYILVDDLKFSVKKEYRPKQSNTQKYTYNISFYGREHDMEDILFCRLNQSDDDLESVFAYDGTPLEFLQKLVDNMNRNTDGVLWRVGEAITADRQNINFNGVYCWDAASEIAKVFETEWWMDGEYLNISKCEHGEKVELGYGEGLKSGLSQEENTNAIKWFTRLIPVGSSKNIDPSVYGYSTLQLPSRAKYIDLNTNLGLKEHREESAFANIFPHRTGTISSTRSEEKTNEETGDFTVYYVSDADLPFNPDDYMIPGKEISMTFDSGDLSGRTFECVWHNDEKEFEIINTYPDEDTQIPGGNLIPQVGDTYVLTDIRMPDSYYPVAEEQYRQAVDDFLKEYSKDVSIYTGETDYIYVDANNVPLLLGQRVRLNSTLYFEEGYRDSRITRVVRKLNNLSEATIECTNAVNTSWKSTVDSSINNMQYVIAQEVAQMVRLLKTGDAEAPSEYTAFSSRRALREIAKNALSRLSDDVAYGIITFLQDIVVNGDARVFAGLKIGEDVIDSLIAGSGIIAKDGLIQADRMELRSSLTVLELIFNRLSAIESDYSFSESGTIESIELLENGTYRLPLRKRWDNDFTALAENDIIYGIVNDLASGSGVYYTSWLRVLHVDTSANAITAVLYPDSEVPGGKNYPPEPLMIITRRGNPVNEDRQAYWYLSTREKCICMLDGVTKPILEENNYAIIIGRLKQLSLFDNLPINYRHSYVYCRGIAFQERLQIQYPGIPVLSLVDRGDWSAEVADSDNPYSVSSTSADTVWHYGCRWQCLINGTLDEPRFGSTGWAMKEGNPNFSIDISSANDWRIDLDKMDENGNLVDDLDTLTITGMLYNRDVTEYILDADVEWTRDSGNVTEDNAWAVKHANTGKVLVLRRDDLGANFVQVGSCKFKATVLLRDGKNVYPDEIEVVI